MELELWLRQGCDVAGFLKQLEMPLVMNSCRAPVVCISSAPLPNAHGSVPVFDENKLIAISQILIDGPDMHTL